MGTSTTGTAVHNALPVSGSFLTEGNTLAALKLAVAASWPALKLFEHGVTVATLAASTYEYSLSALTPAPHPDVGVSRVYIVESSGEPEVAHRRVRQRYDQSDAAWTLIFDPDLVDSFTGKTVNVDYQYPHPAIAALTDTLYLPDEYLVWYCLYWYAMRQLTEQNVDRGAWRDIMLKAEEDYRRALRRHMTPSLPVIHTVGKDRVTNNRLRADRTTI